MKGRLGNIAEFILLAIVCFAPWAFGSVDAWAELVLETGIALVAILALLDGSAARSMRRLHCLPTMALLGLVLLACFQTIPLPDRLIDRLDPALGELRSDLLPSEPERVVGDDSPTVALPLATLSMEPDATVQTARRLAAAWVLFQAVLGLNCGFAGLRRYGFVVTLNATVLALIGLIQALTWNGNLLWIRPLPRIDGWSSGGPFACHSHFAEYLNLGLGFALGFLFAKGRNAVFGTGGNRLWAGYAAGVLVVGIVTSNSRGGVLAMATASFVALVGVVWRSRRLADAIRLLTTVSIVLAIVSVLLVLLGSALPYQERLSTILQTGGAGYTGRFAIWAAAMEAWRDHPFLGTGLGTFAAATAPYFRRDHGVFFARGENEYIDLLCEGGLLGLSLGLAFLVGLGRLAMRAFATAPGDRDRAAVAGGIFGLLTLALHSLSDFGPHIPGVAVPALILAGHLARLGLAARVADTQPARECSSLAGRLAAAPIFAAPAVLAIAIVITGVDPCRVERLVANAGLPLPGVAQPWFDSAELPLEKLNTVRIALERALETRPDWAEGHLRLGQTYLDLYTRSAETLIKPTVNEPVTVALLTDPLWLLGAVHQAERDQRESVYSAKELLAHDPVRNYLVPAARCFLQLRRCSPVSARAHAELASLHYLLANGASPGDYLRRTLRTAGGDRSVLAFAAQVANEINDPTLAALCWRRCLEVRREDWQVIADAAGATLTSEQILAHVIPDGRFAVLFAERLYFANANAVTRDQFLKLALERLPEDQGVSDAERLSLQARAYAGLKIIDRARKSMVEALELEPDRVDWRNQLIVWLLDWGRAKEAHDLALIGVYYCPNDPEARQLLERTNDALARGDSTAQFLGGPP